MKEPLFTGKVALLIRAGSGIGEATALLYATHGAKVIVYVNEGGSNATVGQMKAGLLAKHPIGRLGTAEEVTEIVIWFSSDKASFVTGAYYPVDGGYLAP